MQQRLLSSTALVVAFALCTLIAAETAQAQSNAHVAVGVDLTKRLYKDDAFTRRLHPSFLYRIRKHRQPTNGWRFRVPQFGFTWGGADVTLPVGGVDASFGRVNVVGLLGGVAETLVMNGGTDELSFSLMAGPGLSRFQLKGTARDAFRERLGADPVSIDVKNTFVVRPGVSYWHDLGPRLGFHSSISYVIARPKVVTRTPSGETQTRWHTDHLSLKAGLAVGIF